MNLCREYKHLFTFFHGKGEDEKYGDQDGRINIKVPGRHLNYPEF